jgi:hypothetical protein
VLSASVEPPQAARARASASAGTAAAVRFIGIFLGWWFAGVNDAGAQGLPRGG